MSSDMFHEDKKFTDPTRNFLHSLPEIKQGEQFRFACHSGVSCFNACCSDLAMPLTPYDVLRLCRGLHMGSEEFMENFAIVGCYEDTGFPSLLLRMEDGPGRPCPFVTERGCGVYEHRSSACRTYPLGRATRPAADAPKGEPGDIPLREQYFLVREGHCGGFAESRAWTVSSWLEDQGVEPYNRMNDRYMRLISRYKSVANKAVLSGKHATLALLCLYQQDRFLEFISSVNLFSRVALTGEYAEADIMGDEEKRLQFAFDWLALVLFGSSSSLAPR